MGGTIDDDDRHADDATIFALLRHSCDKNTHRRVLHRSAVTRSKWWPLTELLCEPLLQVFFFFFSACSNVIIFALSTASQPRSPPLCRACQPRSYHGPDLACDHLDTGAWSPAVCAWSPAEGEAEAPQDAISDEAVAAMLEAEEESAEAATATATAGPAAAIEWRDLDKGRFFFFMPATSVCVRVIVYPFGLIKTRMQSAGSRG